MRACSPEKTPTATLAYQEKSKLFYLTLQHLILTCFSGCISHYCCRHPLCSSHATCLPTPALSLITLPAISFSLSLPSKLLLILLRPNSDVFFSSVKSSHLFLFIPHRKCLFLKHFNHGNLTLWTHYSYSSITFQFWGTGTRPLSSLPHSQYYAHDGYLMKTC